jgi:predicted HicB family RNase H-like nuclease
MSTKDKLIERFKMKYLYYKGYRGSIEYSENDNCLYGKVLGLTKDAITYEGATVHELKTDFEEAIETYLEHYQRWNKACDDLVNARVPLEIYS